MYYSDIFRNFEKNKIAYAVVGALASSLHGVVRGSLDLDIAVRFEAENLQKVESSLEELGYTSAIPVSATEIFNFRQQFIEKRNLLNWTFTHNSDATKQVDIIITHDLKDMSFRKLKTKMGIVPLISKKDLISMKRAAARPQDLEDIRALEKL
ncbi:MAG: nucleotidyltransferase family protein [Lentisphaerales bacterium]|nr:nucleotidyltransferase family protein [Lentisphaerales bacterium]